MTAPYKDLSLPLFAVQQDALKVTLSVSGPGAIEQRGEKVTPMAEGDSEPCPGVLRRAKGACERAITPSRQCPEACPEGARRCRLAGGAGLYRSHLLAHHLRDGLLAHDQKAAPNEETGRETWKTPAFEGRLDF